MAENYAALRAAGLVEAGVPKEFGGGGHDVAALSEMLRELAHHCSSTALAFAMHTHQVAIPAWRWVHQKAAPVEPLLKRIAAERIILLSSGGSDWIAGSGTAEKVDGGFRIFARKVFSSGAPAGNLLMTTAVWEGDGNGPQVLHFGIPMNSPQVKIVPVWKAMGMRGTGSHDILIDGHVVPDAGVALKRKAGEWHPLFHIIGTIAIPLIYAVYTGLAEAARDRALAIETARPAGQRNLRLLGEMETRLHAARLAHRAMVDVAMAAKPSAESIDEVMKGRVLVEENALATAGLALNLVGGRGFLRTTGIERIFRDIQGARFHPMRADRQQLYAGALAAGEDVSRIY